MFKAGFIVILVAITVVPMGIVEGAPGAFNVRPWPSEWLAIETPLAAGPGDQLFPDIDGRFLVWEDWNEEVVQVWGMELDARLPTRLGPSPYEQRFPRIRGGIVTYVEGPSYFGCQVDGGAGEFCIAFLDLKTGTRWNRLGNVSRYEVVTTDAYFAQISNFQPTSPSALVVRDLTTGFVVSSLTAAEHPGLIPEIAMDSAEDLISLTTRPYHGVLGLPFRVVNELSVFFTTNFSAVSITQSLDRVREIDPNGNFLMMCFADFTREVAPRLSGTMVYWQDNRNSDFRFGPGDCEIRGEQWDVYGIDLATGTEVAVRAGASNETHPDASGDLLVWADDRNGNWDIYAMRLSTGEERRLTDDPSDQRNPVTSDGCIAWEDRRGGDWDIYGFCTDESSVPAVGLEPPSDGRVRVTWGLDAAADKPIARVNLTHDSRELRDATPTVAVHKTMSDICGPLMRCSGLKHFRAT